MNEKEIKTLEDALHGVSAEIIDAIARNLCSELIGKGLTFRQAEGLLDYAKVLLKSAKI